MSLSDRDLAAARAPFVDWLDTTATVMTYARVSDGGGGFTETWTREDDSVPARVAPLGLGGSGSGERTPRGDRIDDQATVIITLPAGTAITDSDRLCVEGVTYEVMNVRVRSRELSRRVEARQVP